MSIPPGPLKWAPLLKNSITTVPLRVEKMLPSGRVLGTATGFLLTVRDKQYFVTCRHVVSEPTTQGELPAYLSIHLLCESDGPDNSKVPSWIPMSAKLYKEPDRYCDPLWLEHQDGRDVILVPVEVLPWSVTTDAASLKVDQHREVISAGDDVIIAGYPHGLSVHRFPIMKTGMLATDPAIWLDDEPKFLVDSQTRDGMSGAPVFQRRNGDWAHHGMPEGARMLAGPGIGYQFIGIYSGRLRPTKDAPPEPLGYVWRREAIEELFPLRTASE